MNTSRLIALALVPIFFAGCQPQEEDTPGVPDDDRPVEEDRDVMDDDAMGQEYEVGHEESVGLDAVGETEVSGEARLTVTAPNETQVMLELEEGPANAELTGRLTQGTCDELEQTHTPTAERQDQGTQTQQPGAQTQETQQQTPDEDTQPMVGQQGELESVMTDAEGRGVSTTIIDQRLEQFKETGHAVVVEDQQGQLVACGDVDQGLTGAW